MKKLEKHGPTQTFLGQTIREAWSIPPWRLSIVSTRLFTKSIINRYIIDSCVPHSLVATYDSSEIFLQFIWCIMFRKQSNVRLWVFEFLLLCFGETLLYSFRSVDVISSAVVLNRQVRQHGTFSCATNPSSNSNKV